MNKYAALLKEILKEAENPLLGHPIEMIKLDTTDFQGMNKSLIEILGPMGSMREQEQELAFNNYYNGNSSFGDLTTKIFDKNGFDAYFYLTSPNGKKFLAISPSISNNLILNSESKYVLDITSICLFFQLSKELKLRYRHKFIISPSLKKAIINVISNTKYNPETKLSLKITTGGVTPIFYQEGFKENRLKYLEEILEWVENNCVTEQVDEKINLILNLKSNPNVNDDYLFGYIDNRLLIDRSNHYLFTNDMFYFTHLKAGPDRVSSPMLYFEKYHSEKIIECTSYLLKNNYIGVSIYFEILQDEFINMLSGKEHKFTMCLENFNYGWNPNPKHAKVIAHFIKWLYLSNSFITERKNQTAHTLFLSALRNAPASFGLALREELTYEFALLPNLFPLVQASLINALKMIKKTNKLN